MPIRLRAVAHVLGRLLLLLAGAMLVPLAFTLSGGADGPWPFLGAAGLTLGVAAVLLGCGGRQPAEISTREALLCVVAAWVAVALFGSLPFHASGHFGSFTDAVFEATSGFTTTGATVLADVEVLPPSVQFWRHFSHWLGGMGIIMLGIAVLPVVGIGGKALYNAQFAGASSEKLRPRVRETVHALWRVYVTITLCEFLALWCAGMSPFDAICHTFSTLGTGGFSTRTASIAYYDSVLVETILIVFMVVCSLNFAAQYELWVGRLPTSLLKDAEVRFHAGLLALATLGVWSALVLQRGHAPLRALREGAFQVVSIGTTTGFVTADYERWHPFAQAALLVLMYVGGNTGSTAGGFKSFRMVLLLGVVRRALAQVVDRRRVVSVRVAGLTIPDATLTSLLNLVLLAVLFNVVASVLLAATGLDLLTCFSAVPACMSSVGPALGTLGPTENYAHLSTVAKWVLIATMLVGRVEFYTALVLFTPAFWRK